MGKLIRLEIYNFKSYKGHHTLPFGDSYFTSIIGPNGSGKSNSMDAISFVLGIKSSHLRSTQLKELVYRGRVLKHSTIDADGNATELSNGKTNGHVNGDLPSDEEIVDEPSQQRNDPQTAWVMAVFEDDAGKEQKWKRTITRSGSSDYHINGRSVTAKQYNEALEAENILIKARNFLVFQGDVEAIAAQSPKDLTRLIEQISGSLDFKHEYEQRKLESEKAMEDHSFRINQRRAMNSEIKQYQEQKREAETFERKTAQRDEAIVSHILWKLYHLQEHIDASGLQIEKQQGLLKERRKVKEAAEAAFDQAKRDHAKASRECGKVERHIKNKEKEIEENESELVPIDTKIGIATETMSKLQARVDQVSREKDAKQNEVDHYQKSLATVEKARKRWQDEWTKTAQNQGKQLSDADLQEYNKLRGEVTKRSTSAQLQLDGITRQLRSDQETERGLKTKLDSSISQEEKQQEDSTEMANKRNDYTAEFKQTQRDMETKKKQLSQLTSERTRVHQKLTELDEKHQEVLKKLTEADSGRRESDRENRMRETIAAMRRIYPGVRGRVIELVTPKQKKFETAIGYVLGRFCDAIVVDTESTARSCIAYLREQRSGVSTFLPLDTIQVQQVNPNLKGIHKGARLAIDAIDFDPQYERAIAYACGSTLIADSVQIARDICYEKLPGSTAVSTDGTRISRHGNITGGRGAHEKTRRWDDAEVSNLRKLHEKYMAEKTLLQNSPAIHRSQDEETLNGEIASLDHRKEFLQRELLSIERNIKDKKTSIDDLKRQIKETKPKYDQQAKSVQASTRELQKHKAEISKVEDSIFTVFCKKHGYSDVREYEAQQGSLQNEAIEKKLEFDMQKNKLTNQLTLAQQQLDSSKTRIQNMDKTLQQQKQVLVNLEGEKTSIQATITNLEKELGALHDSLNKLQETANEKGETVQEQRREMVRASKFVDETEAEMRQEESSLLASSTEKNGLLRKCRMEETKIPLLKGSRPLSSLPLNDVDVQEDDEDAMDIEQDEARIGNITDYGIELDFDKLDDELKEDDSDKAEERLQENVDKLTSELDKMVPNMRATDRLEGVESRLRDAEKELEIARREAKRAKDDFEDAKDRRFELFKKAYDHISGEIRTVYKDLTTSEQTPMGGQAYLDTEDEEEPYLAGLKYHAMPPLKRFRDMEHLSGGEKTMAALALLFAIHSYQPSPFFVLDEVDAALDNANVARLVGYIRRNAKPGMQFIVISLKPGFFEGSETLVGVMRDQSLNSSKTLTLDLRKYQVA